jgi:nicotinate phosphoribosyltransferase
VDIYGVGTRLATCAGEGGGALGGVYKLVKVGDEPKLKITSDLSKATLPDRKRVLRVLAPNGVFIQDVITLEGEEIGPGSMVYDPANPLQRVRVPADARFVEMRSRVMENGVRCAPAPSLASAADLCADQLRRLPEGCQRLVNPHIYKVSISPGLNELRLKMVAEIEGKFA